MARIRTFKPEFFRSPDTAKASPNARILFMAMWSWADDYGIGETNLNGLLGFAFPDEDQLERADIQRLCKEVADAYGVRFYEHHGRYFYAVPSWDTHQKTERRASRRNPLPDDPDSVPDQRFHCSGGFSDDPQGTSAPTNGETLAGTGEPGNIGTGEITGRATGVRHQSVDAVAPPRKCPKHINDIDPPSCGSCANYRRNFEAWEAKQKLAEKDQLEEKRRQREERENCPRCEGTCTYTDETGETRKCWPHITPEEAVNG